MLFWIKLNCLVWFKFGNLSLPSYFFNIWATKNRIAAKSTGKDFFLINRFIVQYELSISGKAIIHLQTIKHYNFQGLWKQLACVTWLFSIRLTIFVIYKLIQSYTYRLYDPCNIWTSILKNTGPQNSNHIYVE